MQGKRFQHIPETFPLHGFTSIFKPSGIHLSIVRSALHGSFSYLSCSGIGRLIVPGAVSLIIALCISAAPAGAHSPAAMSLAYNETAGELAVTITHQVIDPATHYVREVQLSVDGQTAKTIPYTSQPSATTFTYSYPLQVQEGNSVKVDASCILGGSVTRTLVVPGSTVPHLSYRDQPVPHLSYRDQPVPLL